MHTFILFTLLSTFTITTSYQVIIKSPYHNETLIADATTGVGLAYLSIDLLDLPQPNTKEHKGLICCIKLRNGQGNCDRTIIDDPSTVLSIHRLIPGFQHIVEVTLFGNGNVAPESLLAYAQTPFFVAHHPKNSKDIEISILDARTSNSNSVWQGAATINESKQVNDSTLRGLYFDSVYESRTWSAGGTSSESDSGPGSSLASTEGIRKTLLRVIHDYNISSVLDCPCGDLLWMREINFPKHVRYIGADVSTTLIQNNRIKYPNKQFFVADLVEGEGLNNIRVVRDDAIDKTSTSRTVPELVFVRALQWHLPIQDNLRVLKRLTHFGAKYVMLSTHLRADRNLVDFVLVMGHPVNLFRPPYCIRDPLALYKDGKTEVDVYIGLWKIEVDHLGHPLPLIGSNRECMPGNLSDTYDYKQYPYLNKLGSIPIAHHPDDYLKPGQ